MFNDENYKNNIKDLINKIFKYIIIFNIIFVSCYIILKDKIILSQSILISLIACTTFIIIDKVSPSYIVYYKKE
jgi:hypothetical protein